VVELEFIDADQAKEKHILKSRLVSIIIKIYKIPGGDYFCIEFMKKSGL